MNLITNILTINLFYEFIMEKYLTNTGSAPADKRIRTH